MVDFHSRSRAAEQLGPALVEHTGRGVVGVEQADRGARKLHGEHRRVREHAVQVVRSAPRRSARRVADCSRAERPLRQAARDVLQIAAMRSALSVLVAIAVGGCAVRQLARTVGAGRTEVGVLVGGPLQSQLGFTAPVPEHRVRVRGGLTDDLDLDASVAIGPLSSAILAIDLGFVGQIARTPRFAAAASIRAHCIYDLDDGWRGAYYPEASFHLEHRIERWFALLTGFHLLVQFAPPPDRPWAFWAPYLGVEVLLGEHALSIALAWINPWQSSFSIVRWEPADRGAMVVTFGWRIQPGGIR